MAQIITLKELEEKYGWGFVVFKNLSIDNCSFPYEGEYVFHSQNKSECWEKLEAVYEEGMGVFPFGVNPQYTNVYPSLSALSVVREDSVDYKKKE